MKMVHVRANILKSTYLLFAIKIWPMAFPYKLSSATLGCQIKFSYSNKYNWVIYRFATYCNTYLLNFGLQTVMCCHNITWFSMLVDTYLSVWNLHLWNLIFFQKNFRDLLYTQLSLCKLYSDTFIATFYRVCITPKYICLYVATHCLTGCNSF